MDNPSATALVLLDLRSGLGVEDIAIRRNMDLAKVRAIVADLRENGILAEAWLDA